MSINNNNIKYKAFQIPRILKNFFQLLLIQLIQLQLIFQKFLNTVFRDHYVPVFRSLIGYKHKI